MSDMEKCPCYNGKGYYKRFGAEYLESDSKAHAYEECPDCKGSGNLTKEKK
jgi:hypothetical protein